MNEVRALPSERVCAVDVAYRYPQNDHGLPPTSLEVASGEVVLVTGPSGSGKSTLARSLSGLIPHLYRGTMEGEVWLDGFRTVDAPLWRVAEQVGLVFQNPAAQILTSSVKDEIIFGLENLGLARAEVDVRLEEALRRFGLQPLAERSPHTLSGGEQQKLALATITARRPPVLVLDEPLSMLDSTAANDLIEHLVRLAEGGTTVIVCEHREEYLRDVPGLRHVRLPGAAPERGQRAGRASPLEPLSGPLELQAEDLTVRLGGRAVLKGLDLTLRGGEVTALVGRNGVGKTTLLRVLAGLQKHSGRVEIGGRAPDLGLVFQNADLQLFNATVREEILYRVPEPDMERYTYLIEALGLERYEEVPPLLLSEGEKKRVAVAMVLMHAPRHGLLLDEPALGQDAAHKALLLRLARDVAAGGRIVLITTHDLPLAAQADRLLLLGRAGIVAEGRPEALLREPGPWARLGLEVPGWVLEGLEGAT